MNAFRYIEVIERLRSFQVFVIQIDVSNSKNVRQIDAVPR